MSNYFSSSNTLSSSSISTFVNTYYGKEAKKNNDIYDAFKKMIDDMKMASTTLTEKITEVKTHVMTNITPSKIGESTNVEKNELAKLPAKLPEIPPDQLGGGRKSKKYKKSKKSKKSRKSKKSKTRR